MNLKGAFRYNGNKIEIYPNFTWSEEAFDNRCVAGSGLIAQNKTFLISWATRIELANLKVQTKILEDTQKQINLIKTKLDYLNSESFKK